MAQSGTRVQVLNNVEIEHGSSGYKICFQWCRYNYGDASTPDYGYRFIWKKPDGAMMAHRGQARIESQTVAMRLMGMAVAEGWGNYDGGAVAKSEITRKQAAMGISV